MDAPQIIDLDYKGTRHWFKVWRFTTSKAMYRRMKKDGLTVWPARAVAYTAYTETTTSSEECGRMYFLDKSINSYAHEAVHMAINILERHGFETLDIKNDSMPELEEDFCHLVGLITSALYSQSKFY